MKKIGKRAISLLLSLTIMFSMIFSDGYIDKVYAAETQRIDVTNLDEGATYNHDCKNYAVNKYDSTYHWQICSVCGKEIAGTKAKHSLKDNGWTMGSADICSSSNHHVYTCNCGYSKYDDTGKAEHKYDKPCNCWCRHTHYHCTVCQEPVYQPGVNCNEYCIEVAKKAYAKQGKSLDCLTNFTCPTCGAEYIKDKNTKTWNVKCLEWKNKDNPKKQYLLYGSSNADTWNFTHNRTSRFGKAVSNNYLEIDNDGIWCETCDLKLIESQKSSYKIVDGDGVFTTTFVLPNNAELFSEWCQTIFYGTSGQYYSLDTSKEFKVTHSNGKTYTSKGTQFEKIDAHTVKITSYIKLPTTKHTEVPETVYHEFQYKINGYRYRAISFCKYDDRGDGVQRLHIVPETEAPKISKTSVSPIYSNNSDWATGVKLHFEGTENYCNTITLKIRNATGNIIKTAKVVVSNKKWNYDTILNIEESLTGTKYTVEVEDNLYNLSPQKEFVVSKIDAKAPLITSDTQTSTDWSKEKTWTASATDEGIGNVEIAFHKNTNNDNDAYVKATKSKSGSSYSTNYIFVGDVYGSKKINVVYKDGLNNEAVKTVTISNLDNTAPTITKTDISSSVGSASVTVTANDKKNFGGGGIGVKDGSGVTGYAISTSNKTPSNFQTSNVLTVNKSSTYYVFVKDKVGNVSSKDIGLVNISHTLSFDYNKPSTDSVLTGNDVTSKGITYGGTYGNLPNPSLLGYTFNGWYTAKSDGTNITSTTKYMTDTDTTAYAHWSLNTYKINYDLQGGKISNQPTTYNVNTNTFTIPQPTKKGYVFTGWTGSNGTTPQTNVSITKGSTGDKSYKANWSAVNYSITYKLNGGTIKNAPTSYTIETKTFSIPEPTKNGYSFSGWSGTDISGTSKSVTVNQGSVGNRTYEAHWKALTYSITYDLQGGTISGQPTSYTIESNTFTIPHPTKKGYTFIGWTGSNGDKQQVDVTIPKGSTGDKKYIAHWSANKYTVSFNYNKPSNASSTMTNNGTANKEVVYDSKYGTLPNPSLAGYTFNGWYTSASGGTRVTADTIYKIDGNSTLYAHWTANKYTVTFNYNKPSNASNHIENNNITSKSVTFDSKYGDLPRPSLKGWQFVGWFTAPSDGTQVTADSIYKTAGNQTLYAHWKANNYTVSFDYNKPNKASSEISGNTTTKRIVTYDSKYGPLPSPSITGWSFEGWYTSRDGGTKVTSDSIYRVLGNQTLYAHWKANTYTVTFDYNKPANATSVMADNETTTKKVTYDMPYGSLPNPNMVGWTFDGWYTEKTGGTKITASTMYRTVSNQTLYAHWIANIYTITLDSDLCGYKGTTGTTVIYEKFDTGFYSDKGCTKKITNITIPTKIGNSFNGYKYGNTVVITSTGAIAVNYNKFTSDARIKAEWAALSYTIIFNGNRNSSGNTASMTYVWNNADTARKSLTANGYIRDGWQYVNWNNKTNGSGLSYSDGQLIGNQFFIDNLGMNALLDGKAHTVTLYATWKDIVTPNIKSVAIEQETLLSQVSKGAISLSTQNAYDGDLYTNITVNVDENNSNNDASGIKEVSVYVYDRDNPTINKTYDITDNKSNVINTKYDFAYDNKYNPYSGAYTFKQNLYKEFPDAARLGIYVYVTDYQGNTTNTTARWNKVTNDTSTKKDIPQDKSIIINDDDNTIEDIVFNEINECIYSQYVTVEGSKDFGAGETGIATTWTYGYVESYALDYLEINAEMDREINDNLLSSDNHMNRSKALGCDASGKPLLSNMDIQIVRVPPYALNNLSTPSGQLHHDSTIKYKDLTNNKYNATGYKGTQETGIYNTYNIIDTEFQDVHYRSGV